MPRLYWKAAKGFKPRPLGFGVDWVIIHYTAGFYPSDLDWLTRSRNGPSVHFYICPEGNIYQLVRLYDVAYHAGVTWTLPYTWQWRRWKALRPNERSIGIEISNRYGRDFTEAQFRFLTGWARTTEPGQRVRIVAAGNPPTTPEGRWVVKYWAPWLDEKHGNPALPRELRWFARLDDEDVEVENGEPFEHKGEMVEPKSRTFIPARLSDNPYLANTGYEAILQGLPEPLRSQLLYGDFTVSIRDDKSPQQVQCDSIPVAKDRSAVVLSLPLEA